MDELKLIKNTILQTAKKFNIEIDKIILFGSRARGDHSKDSDWDILVVVSFMDERIKYRFISEVMDALLDRDVDVDVLTVTKDYYERYRDIYGDIAGIATLEGVVL